VSGHLLDVRDLCVSFMTANGEVQAVRGVSFHLDRGETLAIVGESGCGKSVTIQTVMRLNPEPPALIKRGSISYKGSELTGLTDTEMRKYRGKEFAMISQDAMTSLNPTMKVGRQITEAIRAHEPLPRADAKEKAVAMLGKVGLPHPEKAYERFPHTLSGGQRQRAMIALALSMGPSILFADEPTTALDVTIQSQILSLMQVAQRDRDMGILFITHNLGVVARVATRVAVMYAGVIVEYGSLNDIFYHPRHPYTLGLLGSVPDLMADAGKRLYSIPGTPPDLFSPPPGCGFSPRCPYCMKVCMDTPPREYQAGEGHAARCWLCDPACPAPVPAVPVGTAAAGRSA
jgi:oligopeptide transport system ATP-binding protein